MNLLAAQLYDPAVAVSKATSALLAMTAFDTTNLRLAVTVPAHGKVLFKGMVTITGATTLPVVLMGVMNGATVVVRVTPTDYPGTASAATQTVPCRFEAIATGLTPGAANFDLAYGVDVLVAATSFKYGGPNDTTTANAWGAAQFEAWDPQPMQTNGQLVVDANGRVDVAKVAGTAQTARDLGAQLDAAVSTRMATYTQPTGFLAASFPTSVASPTNITAGTITNLTNAPTAGDLTATMKASVTTAATAATPTAAAVTGAVGSVTAGVTLAASQHVIVDSGTVTTLTNLPSVPANWLTAAGIAASALNGKGDWLLSSGYTAPDNAGISTLTGRLTATRAGNLDNVDAAVSSRMASFSLPTNFSSMTISVGGAVTAGTVGDKTGYALTSAYDPAKTAASSADYTAARAAKLDNLDATTSSRLAAAGYTAPDNTGVAAIQAKTDQIAFTVPGQVDANAASVAGTAVHGSGSESDPWGP